MASDTVTKCAHPPCKCIVEVEEPYCSESCASVVDQPHNPCLCGHPECVGAEETIEDLELDVPAA